MGSVRGGETEGRGMFVVKVISTDLRLTNV